MDNKTIRTHDVETQMTKSNVATVSFGSPSFSQERVEGDAAVGGVSMRALMLLALTLTLGACATSQPREVECETASFLNFFHIQHNCKHDEEEAESDVELVPESSAGVAE